MDNAENKKTGRCLNALDEGRCVQAAQGHLQAMRLLTTIGACGCVHEALATLRIAADILETMLRLEGGDEDCDSALQFARDVSAKIVIEEPRADAEGLFGMPGEGGV